MQRAPSLSTIEAFLAAAERGSFRAAADRLCLSAAAVTRRIQAIDRHAGGARTEFGCAHGAAPHTVPEHDCRGIMAPDADRVHGLKVASGAVAISTIAAAAASSSAPSAASRS